MASPTHSLSCAERLWLKDYLFEINFSWQRSFFANFLAKNFTFSSIEIKALLYLQQWSLKPNAILV